MESIFAKLGAMDIWGMVLLALVLFFRDQLINYVGDLWKDIGMYWSRRYDRDGDPATGQWCTAKEPATGENGLCYIEKYSRPHLKPGKRLVFVWFYYDAEQTKMFCAPMPYSAWRPAFTGKLPIDIAKLPFEQYRGC